MHLQHQLSLGTDRVPHRLDQGDGVQGLLMVEFEVTGAEGVDLQRPVPALHDRARRLVVRLRGALGGVPAVGVRLDLVGDLAAQQLPDGDAERLALDVPAGHFDDRDAGHHDLARAAVVAVLHAADQVLDGERVGAEHVVGLGLLQIAQEGVGVAEHPGLADPGDSLVGVHLDVRQVAPRRPDHVCADSGDAHGSWPLAAVVTGIGCGGSTRSIFRHTFEMLARQ